MNGFIALYVHETSGGWSQGWVCVCVQCSQGGLSCIIICMYVSSCNYIDHPISWKLGKVFLECCSPA